MLRKPQIFGDRYIWIYLCYMTFKELTKELLDQGWRAYHLEDTSLLTRGNYLEALAIRKLIQVQVYEGEKVVFVKDCKPKKNE